MLPILSWWDGFSLKWVYKTQYGQYSTYRFATRSLYFFLILCFFSRTYENTDCVSLPLTLFSSLSLLHILAFLQVFMVGHLEVSRCSSKSYSAVTKAVHILSSVCLRLEIFNVKLLREFGQITLTLLACVSGPNNYGSAGRLVECYNDTFSCSIYHIYIYSWWFVFVMVKNLQETARGKIFF